MNDALLAEITQRIVAEAGAPAAKLAGAGGGTIIALWPSPDRAPLEAALRAAAPASCMRSGRWRG